MTFVTVGADPELFFKDLSGKFISAVDKVGGSKHNPRPLDVDGCAVQEDNVAAEFNIPPAQTYQEFREYIQYVVKYLDSHATKMGLMLARHVASATFDNDQLNTWQSQVFGCEPDMNAWTGRENPKPHAENPNLRSCGGHIHVGTGDLNPALVVRSMDYHLGVPSLALDKDTERRKLYGGPGAYRRKPYGIEYRTLSNFWIWSDDLIQWAWEGTQNAVKFVRDGGDISVTLGKEIQKAITTGDEKAYNNVMESLRGHYQL